MSKTLRPGPVGAMMDEYERALAEFTRLIGGLSDAEFEALRDRQTTDPDCRTIQTVVHHVVRAGYGYSDYIRTAFSVASTRPELAVGTRTEALSQLATMIAYAAATLEGRWQMTDEAIVAVQMKVRWGPVYDLEQLLEHAIVHVLRHRRQIERFLKEPQFAPGPPI